MSVRVVLVRPPISVFHKFSKLVENLAIGYLATALRSHGHEAILVDAMMTDATPEQVASDVLQLEPDAVGMTVVLQHFPPEVGEIARLLREGGHGGPIVVGGHSVSFFPERILRAVEHVDAVICGEGEEAICELADALAHAGDWTTASGLAFRDGGTVARNPTKRIANLDALGHPARDLTPEIIAGDGLSAVSTSRGCYARCSFCSVPRFYGLDQQRVLAPGHWLARSVTGAVEDIVELHRQFGIREVLIVDDEFFGGAGDTARAMRFGRALEELSLPVRFALSCRAENVEAGVLEQLQRGGLAHVFVGLEAGNAVDLKLYGKNHSTEQNRRAVEIIKGFGLSFQPGFMLFNYRSTLAGVRESLEFLEDIGELKPVTINSAVDPHFGIPLVRDMDRLGVLEDDMLSMRAHYLDPRVAVAKDVAGRAAAAFQPHMDFIAGIRSAVTYEWRRSLPWRRPQEERLLDAFEEHVNSEFAGVVWNAVERLDELSPNDAEGVIRDAESRLEATGRRLEAAKALLVAHIQSVEGSIGYVTQSDIISGGALTTAQ